MHRAGRPAKYLISHDTAGALSCCRMTKHKSLFTRYGTGMLLVEVNESGRIYRSGTVVNGRYLLRLCVLSHRSHAEHVRDAVGVLREAARQASRACSAERPGTTVSEIKRSPFGLS